MHRASRDATTRARLQAEHTAMRSKSTDPMDVDSVTLFTILRHKCHVQPLPRGAVFLLLGPSSGIEGHQESQFLVWLRLEGLFFTCCARILTICDTSSRSAWMGPFSHSVRRALLYQTLRKYADLGIRQCATRPCRACVIVRCECTGCAQVCAASWPIADAAAHLVAQLAIVYSRRPFCDGQWRSQRLVLGLSAHAGPGAASSTGAHC